MITFYDRQMYELILLKCRYSIRLSKIVHSKSERKIVTDKDACKKRMRFKIYRVKCTDSFKFLLYINR